MAMSNADRSAKAAAKRKFGCTAWREDACTGLTDGLERYREQGEAITLMIHHLNNLGPGGALPCWHLRDTKSRFRHLWRGSLSGSMLVGNRVRRDCYLTTIRKILGVLIPHLVSHAGQQVLWHR